MAHLHNERTDNYFCDRHGRPLIEAHTFSLKGTELYEGDAPNLLEMQTLLRDGIISPIAPSFMQKVMRMLDWQEESRRKAIEEVLAEGRAEGIAVGRVEGKAVGRTEVGQSIVRRFARVMSVEQMAEILKLPVEEIQRLLDSK